MKRIQIVLASGLGLFAIGCGVLIWQLLGAMGALSEARENNESNMSQLQQLYKQKVFPTKQNIEQLRKDKEVLVAWVDVATNRLRHGDIKVAEQTPSGFKQLLQDMVRDLSMQPGQVAGKICAPNFYFGFDKYLGDSAVLPDSKHSSKLAVQLMLIDKICRELIKAGAVQIDLVEREKFDDKVQEEAEEEPREERRNRRSRRRNAMAAKEEKAAQPAGPTLAAKQTFSIGFQARPEALITALNGLARIEPFMVVSSVEMNAGGDPLMAYAQSLSAEDAIKAREKEEGKEELLSDGKGEVYRKIVTSPEMEAPLKVKLQIDVYNFEGV